ncbi:MAG: hypothetical protein RL264_1893 [Bacteroidota bacterium]|jgi:hypothetical protein
MRTCFLSSLLFVCLALPSFLKGATNHYTLSYRDNPSTTIVIGWSGDDAIVYYGTTDFGTTVSSYPNQKTVDRQATAHGINRKFARLTGLSPKTTYYFVIKDVNNVVSARFKFVTLSDNPNDPVSFISGGDTRDGFKVFGAYVEDCPSGNCLEQKRKGNRLVAKLRPDFIAFNGDFVMNQVTSNTNAEWTEYLNDWQLTISSDGRMYPMTFTQGNHEDNQDMYNLFDIPMEEYYALTINNGLLRLYMLNSELNACSNTQQLNWFTNDLQNNTNTANDPTWKFVQYHIPTFAMGNSYGLVGDQMSCWVNLFEQYKIRLAMESHTHITKWTYPCKANSSDTDFQLDNEGIVYIGEGQWGAPHRTLDFTGNNQKPYIRAQGVFDNFYFIRVTPQQTSIKSVLFNGNENLTALTSDDLGKELPAGTQVWSPSTGNEIVIQNNGVGLKELKGLSAKIYPNPVISTLTIESSKSLTNATIEVYNGLGKLVKTEQVKSTSKLEIDLQQMPAGQGNLVIKFSDGKIENHYFVKM